MSNLDVIHMRVKWLKIEILTYEFPSCNEGELYEKMKDLALL